MPESFDFEDEHKPFVLMAKIKLILFIHAEMEYVKKDIVIDSHSWVDPT